MLIQNQEVKNLSILTPRTAGNGEWVGWVYYYSRTTSMAYLTKPDKQQKETKENQGQCSMNKVSLVFH